MNLIFEILFLFGLVSIGVIIAAVIITRRRKAAGKKTGISSGYSARPSEKSPHDENGTPPN